MTQRLILTGNTRALVGLASVTGASAWGYGIYNNMDDIWGFFSRIFGAAMQTAPRLKDSTADTLEALLDSKLAQRSTPPVTIVHSGDGKGSSTMTYVVMLAGGAVAVYVMAYRTVSRENVNASISSLGKAVSAISKAVLNVRTEMKGEFTDLAGKVEDGLDVQDEIKEELGQVHSTVEEVQHATTEITSVVRECEQNLLEVAQKQDVTCRGVQLLCAVVAESMGANSKSGKKLESFLRDSAYMLPPAPAAFSRSRSSPLPRITSQSRRSNSHARLMNEAARDLNADNAYGFPEGERAMTPEDQEHSSYSSYDEMVPPKRK